MIHMKWWEYYTIYKQLQLVETNVKYVYMRDYFNIHTGMYRYVQHRAAITENEITSWPVTGWEFGSIYDLRFV